MVSGELIGTTGRGGRASLGSPRFLEDQGWSVIRVSNEDVLKDVAAVAISIAKQSGSEVSFGQRVRVASGMRCKKG